ncbi:DNA repair protein RecO [Conchiformibius kuhniae]|uniref:DNA repair protein RecO n=1 Tax=Conchiformibius kuhniae TaxID=211502 RepID=A0A8T9MWN7_9NEIS|nr:DNA repair protein RecO [Conchiformibius kuhniae]UOP04866.1 DNA repair protein RecO [Conchiformibius kuhniae]
MSRDRINGQPVFLLHSKAWRENSLRLEVFSRDYGRVALLARSARTRGSELRGVVVPFVPFSASWYGREELKTLHRAEWLGGWAQPQGQSLFSSLYVNELVCRLTAPEDPNPPLYDALAQALRDICCHRRHTAALRRFEWALLHALGLCADWQQDADGNAVSAQARYRICPESPPQRLPDGAPAPDAGITVYGRVLAGIRNGILDDDGDVRAAAALMKMLVGFRLPEPQTRTVLQQLKAFKSRLPPAPPERVII